MSELKLQILEMFIAELKKAFTEGKVTRVKSFPSIGSFHIDVDPSSSEAASLAAALQ